MVTALTVVVAVGLVVLTIAAVAGARVLVTQRRAAAAADLGALAGAVALQRGQDGCAAARRLVRRSGAQVEQCGVEGDHVRVTVVRDAGTVAGRRLRVAARAHAGPR
jgi:secretion/DNA translocation related TadE-like protein